MLCLYKLFFNYYFDLVKVYVFCLKLEKKLNYFNLFLV